MNPEALSTPRLDLQANPDAIRHVLQENHGNYDDKVDASGRELRINLGAANSG